MLSQDAKSDCLLEKMGIDDMLAALPLVHKYDCPVAKMVMEQHMELRAFRGTGALGNGKRMDPAPWLTQSHIEYIVVKQELFGPESLSDSMNRTVVALMLSTSDRIDVQFNQRKRLLEPGRRKYMSVVPAEPPDWRTSWKQRQPSSSAGAPPHLVR